MENNVKYAKENIEWIRKGLKIFYPSYFYTPDEALRQPFVNQYEGYKKSTFIGYVFLITNTNETSDAIRVLDYWLELLEYPEATMPEEIIEEVKEIKESATLGAPEKERLEKKLQILPQTLKAKKQEIPQPKEVKERKTYGKVPPVQVEVTTKLQQEPAQEVEIPQQIPVPEAVEPPSPDVGTTPPSQIPVAQDVQVKSDDDKLQNELEKPLKVIQEKNPTLPNLYVKLTEPEKRVLSAEEIKYIREELIIPAHNDPRGFSEKLAQSIIENAPQKVKDNTLPEQLKVTADFLAIGFTDKLLELNPDTFTEDAQRIHPVEIVSALVNPDNPELGKIISDPEVRLAISSIAQQTAFTLEHDSLMAVNLLGSSPSVGQDIANYFYSFREKGQELSDKEVPNSAKIEVDKLVESFRQAAKVKWEIYNYIRKNNPQALQEISDKSMDEIVKKTLWHQRSQVFAGRFLETQLKQLGIAPGTFEYEYYQTSRLVQIWADKNISLLVPAIGGYYPSQERNDVYLAYFQTPIINTSFGESSFNIVSWGGNTIFKWGLRKGAEKGLSMLGLGNILAPAAEAATAGAGVAAEGAAVATAETTAVAAGTAAGVVPGVIAAGVIVAKKVLSWVAKTITEKIAKNKELAIAILAAPVFLAGMIFRIPILSVIALTSGLGAFVLIRAGGVTSAASLGGAFIKSFLVGITNVALPSIGVPMIVAALGIPLITAFIFLVINSGAYIVPPGTSTVNVGFGGVESAYIEVIKNPNPSGPFDNQDLPIEVEYTVTIKARKGTLSNITIDYNCSVTKDGSSPNCPETEPKIPLGIEIPETISPTSAFTFTYKQRYEGTDYEDSLVIDTISVSAVAPEVGGEKATGSASIIIGNPPDECPKIWPILPEGSESSLTITQGPLGAASHSRGVEAIDVSATIGHSVFATHSGIVTIWETNGLYLPVVIKITSTCGGVSFQSWYAHLNTVEVAEGSHVTMGQKIGTSGTNYPGNGHLHYEFRGLKMALPYIPKEVPYRCTQNCGTIP